jgi:DnaJ-class molecular chaperone
MTTDYYQILGVERNASEEDIKRSYRKLAMRHHPDRTGGDDTEFKKVQEAYATLGDPSKRQQYDNPQPQGFPGFHQGRGDPLTDFMAHAFGGSSPFGDIFGRPMQPQQQRNRTLNIQTAITLEEAFHGKDLIATLRLPSGRDQVVEVRIPAGINDGITLRLQELGDDTHVNLPRGDLHLTIHVHPHPVFQRQGDDLVTNINLSCIDAMLGTAIHVTTLDHRNLEIKINPGTQHGQVLAAAGCGMPKASDNRFKGRLLLNVNITVPDNISERQKELLRQFIN